MGIAITVLSYVSICYVLGGVESVFGLDPRILFAIIVILAPVDIYYRLKRGYTKNVKTTK
jgi:hypothetical protein